MSKIKFRLWEKELKAMVTDENSDQFLISLDGRVFDTGFTFSSQAEYCKNMTAMQFTGLKDNNGVEIYEGDICKCNYFNGSKSKCHFEVVEFNNGKFDLTWTISKLFKSFRSRSCFNGHSEAFEVIGNIYENPELLK